MDVFRLRLPGPGALAFLCATTALAGPTQGGDLFDASFLPPAEGRKVLTN